MAKQQICSACGSQGKPKSHTRGSIIIEIFLWLCMLIPGLLYSLWRLSTRKQVCGQCSADKLIPVDSPMGKKLAQDLGK